MADDVRLTDLQVIQRYSIAVRGETADRDDLISALRADLDWLQGSQQRSRSGPAERATSSRGSADDEAPPARRAAVARPAAARRPASSASSAKGGRARAPQQATAKRTAAAAKPAKAAKATKATRTTKATKSARRGR